MIPLIELINRRIPRSKLIRGVGVLASGTVLGQLIQILATPLLTRIYTPAEFGILAVFVGLLGPITVVACLRFEMAITLPRRDGAAYQVVGLALAILLATTAITSLMGLGFGQSILRAVGSEHLTSYYWLLPVGIFLGGLYQLSSMWAIRKKAFKVIAKTRVQQGVGAAAIQGGLGILGFGSPGLILGQIAGQAIGLSRLSKNLLIDYRRQHIRVSTKGMFWAARRFHKFFKYDSLASLLNTAGAQVPAILFAMYFGSAVAGAYLLSVRLLSAPISLIGKTLVQALLPDMVEARYMDRLPVMVRKIRRTLTTLSLAPFLIFALIAPLVFGHIFGKNWSEAGAIAGWTAIWIGFQFTYSPLSVVLLAVEAQKLNLIMQSLFFGARLAAIYMCYNFGLLHQAVALYSGVSAIFYLAAIVVIEKRAGISLASAMAEMIRGISGALATIFPVALAIVFKCGLISTCLLTMLSAAIWLYRLWALRRNDGTAVFPS